MRPNPTNRPTIADFALMLADAAQGWGTIIHDNGTMNDEDTANEVISRLGDFAEELAITDLSANRLCALMEAANAYAANARTAQQQKTATAAAHALQAVVTLWGLIKDYRPELWQLAAASKNYDDAIMAARRHEWEADAAGTDEAETHEPETATDNTPEQ